MNRRQFAANSLSIAACGIATLLGPGSGEAVTRSRAHVYLLRGLLGLSQGLDVLAEKLKRRGINATVHGYGEASALAAEAARNYKSGREERIVLIGHSLGGSAVLAMAEQLGGAGVQVALVVTIDPTSATPASANVRRAINLYISSGMGVAIARGPNFRGQLQNLDFKNLPEMGHMSIQTSDKVHQQVISYVLAAI